IHRSKEARAAIPDLWARGVYLYFLPAYSPELNAIEPAFRAIKHDRMPERRYATLAALIDAVHTAFTTYEEALIAISVPHPRPAAQGDFQRADTFVRRRGHTARFRSATQITR